MPINGVIQRKFARMEEELTRLAAVLRDVSKERFVSDWALRTITERVLQVCTEIMIDIAERVLALKGGGPASSSADCLERLALMGVLRSAAPYAEMARFRNLLVHQYEAIDPAIVYRIATNHLGDFRRFRDEIDQALSQI